MKIEIYQKCITFAAANLPLWADELHWKDGRVVECGGLENR